MKAVTTNVQYSFAKNYKEQAEKVKDGHTIGENGTKMDGSKTLYKGNDGSRIDVENPPGRDGQVHYQEKGNMDKWIYDIKAGKFRALDNKGGGLAPKRIQDKLKDPDFKKAIQKGVEQYLNEDY